MSTTQTPKKTAPTAMAIAGILALVVVVLVYLYPDRAYLWVKALHVIAVISWMAGMLYLPRLFVYHYAAEKGSVQSETFKVMERRLLKAIITPAMIVTWGQGFGWRGKPRPIWTAGSTLNFWQFLSFPASMVTFPKLSGCLRRIVMRNLPASGV